MCEVGLRSNKETEEGIKAAINRPELFTVNEEDNEAKDRHFDVDGDDDDDDDDVVRFPNCQVSNE